MFLILMGIPSHREDGVLVEHVGAHVGQLSELPVGDGLNGGGILHDPGVGHQEAGNVGPVFIKVGVEGAGHQRAGHIGAASGKGGDGAVGL